MKLVHVTVGLLVVAGQSGLGLQIAHAGSASGNASASVVELTAVGIVEAAPDDRSTSDSDDALPANLSAVRSSAASFNLATTPRMTTSFDIVVEGGGTFAISLPPERIFISDDDGHTLQIAAVVRAPNDAEGEPPGLVNVHVDASVDPQFSGSHTVSFPIMVEHN